MFSKIKNIMQQLLGKKNRAKAANIKDSENAAEALQVPKASSKSTGPDYALASKQAKRRQDWIMMAILGVILLIMLIWMHYNKMQARQVDEDEPKTALNLEVASNALDSEKMWRNYFEEKLEANKKQSEKKIQLIEDSLNEQSSAYQQQLKDEIKKLKQQMQYLADEQSASKLQLNNIKSQSVRDNSDNNQGYKKQEPANIKVNAMYKNDYYDIPKSARNFIPETSYVKGVLLGGISVSTAMGSSSEPVPVIIKITDRGNLPKNFNMDVRQCQILGSSYGDISSERAIIRAETLSCNDIRQELIYTTKVAGLVYGDDGFNGIKGKVIQTSSKHLKNAMIGGMISGFSGPAQGQDQFSISSMGIINSKKKNIGDMAQESALRGLGNASEKLADYYIKQAEAMSPVLMVPGGSRVDVVFTKGVYFGAQDVEEKLRKARKGQK